MKSVSTPTNNNSTGNVGHQGPNSQQNTVLCTILYSVVARPQATKIEEILIRKSLLNQGIADYTGTETVAKNLSLKNYCGN